MGLIGLKMQIYKENQKNDYLCRIEIHLNTIDHGSKRTSTESHA
jgi:hypothetical protein